MEMLPAALRLLWRALAPLPSELGIGTFSVIVVTVSVGTFFVTFFFTNRKLGLKSALAEKWRGTLKITAILYTAIFLITGTLAVTRTIYDEHVAAIADISSLAAQVAALESQFLVNEIRYVENQQDGGTPAFPNTLV